MMMMMTITMMMVIMIVMIDRTCCISNVVVVSLPQQMPSVPEYEFLISEVISRLDTFWQGDFASLKNSP